jgi:calcineurin-like phosphoesterase family protein
MDEQLIRNWNNVVKKDDEVYHLGYAFFGNDLDRSRSIFDRLNGVIYLVKGNHDKICWQMKDRFEWIKDYFKLSVQDKDGYRGSQQVILCHYAFRVWDRSHFGTINCHGHSHSKLPDDPTMLQMDVGVDAIVARLGKRPEDYRPISYTEVKKIMSQKNRISPIKNRDEYFFCAKKVTT